MDTSNYGIKDIKSLSFKEGVQQRIQMYLGSSDNEGTYQAFKEIINNSTDEAIAGYGKQIDISVNEKENSISIRDYGRSVPFGIREDGENVLISIYSKSHTGGKFEEGAYKNSSGLNGIGAKCVCLSSKKFIVRSYRNGTMAEAIFEDGDLISYKESETKEKTGTYVWFAPSEKVFNTGKIGYDFNRICESIKDISYLYQGLTFNIYNELTNKTTTYCAKNGLKDYIKDHLDTPINKTVNYKKVTDGVDEVEIVYQWGSRVETPVIFVNGLLCVNGGTPVTGARTAVTRMINSLSGQKLSGEAIRSNLFFVVNCKVKNPSFSNQTKDSINNPSLRTLTSQAFTESLKEYYETNKDDFNKVVNLLTKVEKAEAAAERARQQIMNSVKEVEKNQKRKVFASDKLKDAEYLGQDSTLLLVEGLSAASSMAMARDEKKYGILALRGKPINGFANDEEKFYQNEEINLLLSAMNIVPGKYNSKKLRYGKIAICSDSDADGYAIGLLIMCAIYKVAPEFIKEGRLYWLRSPLYIVKNGKEEKYYFTDEEFNKLKNVKGTVQRCKGLGSLNAEQAHTSMFTKEFQKMEQLIPDDNTYELLSTLMGKDSAPKREFIFNNVDFSTISE